MDERGLKEKQDFLRVILAGQKGKRIEEGGTTEVDGKACRDLLQRLTLAAIAGYFRLPNMMFPGMSSISLRTMPMTPEQRPMMKVSALNPSENSGDFGGNYTYGKAMI